MLTRVVADVSLYGAIGDPPEPPVLPHGQQGLVELPLPVGQHPRQGLGPSAEDPTGSSQGLGEGTGGGGCQSY